MGRGPGSGVKAGSRGTLSIRPTSAEPRGPGTFAPFGRLTDLVRKWTDPLAKPACPPLCPPALTCPPPDVTASPSRKSLLGAQGGVARSPCD